MGVNYCVNKPNLLGFLGIEGLAGGGHVQGVGDAGEGGQALSSSSSWENPKHDLRNPHTCLHTIHSNPVVTSHGNLQPSSQAGPLDSGHHGLLALLHLEEKVLATLGQSGGLLSGLAVGQHVDVCPGNEAAWLARHEDSRLGGRIIYELVESFLKLSRGLLAQGVDF